MRDPQASIRVGEFRVVRSLREPLPTTHFLRSALAARWVVQRRFVAFELDDDLTVSSTRLPFVTYPQEWCDAQLFDGAQLTLALQQEAVAEGFDLKDASAWNVLFDGGRPLFCDLLSFAPLEARKWWAAGQFSRHFVLPLLLAQRRGLRGHQSFLVWRDGVPPATAREMFGTRRFLTKYWPLMADGSGGVHADTGDFAPSVDRASAQRFRDGLHASLTWMLEGVKPRSAGAPSPDAPWAGYVDQRAHYDSQNLVTKRVTVDQWLRLAAPAWVADLGCNTGEFSRIAAEQGANVVAIDADHDCIDRLFRSAGAASRLHCVVATLDDLGNGRGWAGGEFSGLAQRMTQHFDLVMMLALIHHLAIGASIPLPDVARFAARCTRDWVIVEFIDVADPQLASLCAQRQREPADFGIDRQRAAFVEAGFVLEAEVTLAPAHRVLALLRKRVTSNFP